METLSLGVLTYLANAIWEVALVAVAAALAERVLRRAPSRYRHALWLMALAVATFLPLASLTAPHRAKVALAIAAGEASTLELSPSSGSSSIGPSDVTREAPRRSQPLRLEPPVTLWHGWPFEVNRFLAYALLALYAGFLLFRLHKLARAWRRTNQLRAGAVPRDLPQPVAEIVARCRSAFGWRPSADSANASPQFLFSSAVSLPVTLGALRPAIIFPESMIETMDAAELAAALSHELAHVRRRDYLLNLLSEIFLLPLSFHPAAVFLKRRIDQTRELATDELAAGAAQDRARYADALLSMARRIAAPAPAAVQPAGYTLGVLETDNLEERIMKLMEKTSAISRRVVWLSVAVGFVLLAATGLAASMFSLAPSLQQAAGQATQEENTGGVSGVVTDPYGARMPDRAVTLSSKEKNFQKVVTTNQKGEYAFERLVPGIYTLEVKNPSLHARYFARVLIGPAQPKPEFKGTPYEFAPSQPFIPVVLNRPPGMAEIAAAPPGAPLPSWVTVVTAKAPPEAPLPPPKPAGPSPQRVRLGEPVEAEKLIVHPAPEYPPLAKNAHIQGVARLEAVIGTDGTIQDLKTISGHPLLVMAALEAVRQWRYKPTLLNGVPVEVETNITIMFKLEH